MSLFLSMAAFVCSKWRVAELQAVVDGFCLKHSPTERMMTERAQTRRVVYTKVG